MLFITAHPVTFLIKQILKNESYTAYLKLKRANVVHYSSSSCFSYQTDIKERVYNFNFISILGADPFSTHIIKAVHYRIVFYHTIMVGYLLRNIFQSTKGVWHVRLILKCINMLPTHGCELCRHSTVLNDSLVICVVWFLIGFQCPASEGV